MWLVIDKLSTSFTFYSVFNQVTTKMSTFPARHQKAPDVNKLYYSAREKCSRDMSDSAPSVKQRK